ncbi:MAG: hypothetical protein AAF633_18975, partial [Chloroflexota bacterium]
MKRNRTLPLLIVALLLGAVSCKTAPETEVVALPTVAALIQITESPTPEPLPITFTPGPELAVTSDQLTPSSGVQLNREATATLFIPTNSPVPTETSTPTETPEVTPTVPAFDAQSLARRYGLLTPSAELGPSKLSLHVIRNNDPNIMRFVREGQPALIKAVDDLGFLAEVKEASPNTITIGRIDDIYVQNYIGDPAEAAREYVERQLPKYRLNPAVDYWEGWNEPDPESIALMEWYARFEQERIRVMAGYGLKSAIGGFPPGVPELNEFEAFLPAIETGIEYGAILTLHEGDIETGDMRFLYGSPLPGYPA